MDNDNREGEYEVGYGKPPRNTRFRKGQSGNYRGRPRSAKNLATLFDEAVREQLVINENGRRKTATKLKVAFKQWINKAVQGDFRSLQLLISFMEKHPQADVQNTTMTAEEIDRKTNLLGEAVGILADLRVPIPTATDVGRAAVLRAGLTTALTSGDQSVVPDP